MPDRIPSVTSFRDRVRQMLEQEVAGEARDVIILAVDGIPLDLSRRLWRSAEITPMSSVVPTTSVASWLSSLTGLPVDRHGVPGVVIRLKHAGIVDVLKYKGALDVPMTGNIFSDAERLGYLPIAVQGDWEPYDCSWRETLLGDARCVSGHLFYAGQTAPPEEIGRSIVTAIEPLRSAAGERPRLIWCFIDADLAVHRDGYSPDVCALVELVDSIAAQWVREGTVVIAHSDHGLTPTRHSPEIQNLIDSITKRFDCTLGGAGRMRWVYAPAESLDDAMFTLRAELPASIHVIPSDHLFAPGSLARERVGDILLVAMDREFITFGGQIFEHGSMLQEELLVPLARWGH